MGLDMTIRAIRKDAVATEDEFDQLIYDADDIQYLMEGSGRGEFAWLREWVGDDRYGKYIDVTPDIADELIELATGSCEYLPDLEFGTGRCIALLSLAKLYDKFGYKLQIECDW